MKLNLRSILILSVLLISFGCGSKMSSTTKKSSSQEALIAKKGVQVVSAPSEYVGTWEGHIQSSLATMEINPNGAIQFKMEGKVINEKLVRDTDNIFYMTDTIENQLIKIEPRGETMTFFASAEDLFYFSRK